MRKSKNGVSVSVEYLIVDQKQVNIFFRVNSEKIQPSRHRSPRSKTQTAASSPAPIPPQRLGCREMEAYRASLWILQTGMCRTLWRDDIKAVRRGCKETHPVEDSEFPDATYDQPPYIAVFQFQPHFDPVFTATGKKIPSIKTVILDGQKVTFTDIEIYPTHMRIDIKTDTSNTAWLASLDFYILADGGKKFKPNANGITSQGEARSPWR